MMRTYVLWTEFGKEGHLKEVLENTIIPLLPETSIFIPQKKKLLRGPNGWGEVNDILFPNYVFMDTPDINAVHAVLYQPKIATAYHLLGMDENNILAVKPDEKAWIEHMCDEKGIAGISRGIKEGTTVRFTEGPLVGMEAYVKKIDRHHRFAELQMEFFGAMRKITLACEIIS